MLKTAIYDLFNIEHPIIQGGTSWTGTHELVSTISSTGKQRLFNRDHIYLGVTEGNLNQDSQLADQVTGIINDIKPARAIIEEMVAYAESIFRWAYLRFVHE